ncbi:unnamed protein product [Cyclocybe aegerita]|uniref:Uncharacterized protein n=1 Tax=Cyclocybe aegerita TaxID=1973307 RepID=A0A8S0W3T1_CYCAE|nr:unnamed protein product [Cyclocybe aegerita]
MSTLHLRFPRKVHDLQDNLEFFFYVVLFYTLQYLPISISQLELVDLMKAIFEECTPMYALGINIGGQAKARLLAGADTSFFCLVSIDNPPVNSWMRASWLAFEELHWYIEDEKLKVLRARMSDSAILTQEVQQTTQMPTLAPHIRLRDHSHFFKIFKDVLALEEWSQARKPTAAAH